MGQDQVGSVGSVSFGKIYQPLLARSGFHGAVIFPVGNGSVEVVGFDKICQIFPAGDSVGTTVIWKLVIAERTDQYSHSFIVVFFSETGLNLFGVGTVTGNSVLTDGRP